MNWNGHWQGTNKLWFEPGGECHQSPISLTANAVRDQLLEVAYEWQYQNQPKIGRLMVSLTGNTAAWYDSFHFDSDLWVCDVEQQAEGLNLSGTYPAPPGPDWGWRITLGKDLGQFLMRMYNITPEGEEALAVEALLEKKDGDG